MSHEFSRIHLRRRKTVSADSKICSGCRTCEIVCSLAHEGSIDLELSRIFVKSDSFTGSFIPIVCHQCSDVPCYYACPESAIEIEDSLGTVVINRNKCTGCFACGKACPFKVIRLDAESKALKCDYCQGSPKCVSWCPMNALGITEFRGEN